MDGKTWHIEVAGSKVQRTEQDQATQVRKKREGAEAALQH